METEHIKELTIDSFMDALDSCYLLAHHKVIIFLDGLSALHEFSEAIQRAGEMPDVLRFHSCHDSMTLLFENGSSICAYPFINESIRGSRCHEILYDPAIHNFGDYDAFLRHMIVKRNVNKDLIKKLSMEANQITGAYEQDAGDDLPELDEFLDGFKIINNT